jgi:hypothetical protein
VSVPFAHVAGVPVEEGLLTLAPAGCAVAFAARARLLEFVRWLRRR